MSVLVCQYPHRPNVRWEKWNGAVKLFCGKKCLRVQVQNQREHNFYITFPSFGGVRLRGSNAGFFEPEELYDIEYQYPDEDTLQLIGKDAEVIVRHGAEGWSVQIYDNDGKLCTSISQDTFFYGFDKELTYQSVYWEFPIRAEEHFYGFGEHFNHLEQKDIQLTMWNTDCLVGIPLIDLHEEGEPTQSYKNVPLVHSSLGHSIFFNTYYPIRFNVGAQYSHKFGVEIYGYQFDIYVWTGTIEKNIHSYLELTGKPFLPPKWAFDYWMGGAWNVWNLPNDTYALANIEETLDKYEEMGVKIGPSYFEMNADPAIFEMLKRRGVTPLMWTNSCLLPKWGGTLDYTDYMVKKCSKPEENMEFEYIDFTAPKSRTAVWNKMSIVWDEGVKGMMVDFADNMPEDSLCSNGKDGREMHNGYAYWYARRMNEAFQERLGGDFMLFQRSGTAGSQHYTASFGGDIPSCFLGLKRSVSEMLSAAASGFSVWGSDMGGFYEVKGSDHDKVELYLRWVQFSTFSPLMRCHGLKPNHPWIYGEEGKKGFQKYYAIRQSLLNKIYSTAIRTSIEGDTMVKSMAVAFEMSPAIESQYLFCDDILVCPIVEEGQRETTVILPEDGWTDVYTGEVWNAGEYTVKTPADEIPIYIRSGAVMPVTVQEETLLPTLDLKHTVNALLLTKPTAERTTSIYTAPEESNTFRSILCEDGFLLTATKECEHTCILVPGTCGVATCDSSVLSCSYHSEVHLTEIRLQGNWTTMKIMEED